MLRKIEYADEEQFRSLKPGTKIEISGMNGAYYVISSEPFIDKDTGDLSVLAGGTLISYKNEIFVTAEPDEGKTFNLDVTDIRSFCYRLYQYDWKSKNRITPQDEADVMKAYLKVYPPEKFTIANPPDQTFEEYLAEHGYEGKFWHSYEYFCENIYPVEHYIAEIMYGLDRMDDYRKDLDVLLKEHDGFDI